MTTINLKKADAFIKEAKKNVHPRYRLGYHIMAPANWINDPNGLVQYKGEYHVFFQHHPYDENWGPMHWGHVKSKDLIHWEHCPIALAPGDACDKDGCFSGSAVVDGEELVLIYTGHHLIDKEKDTFFQNQNIAISQDGLHFTKYEQNPVIAKPPHGSTQHFRDPKVWKHNNDWYMITGHQTEDGIGQVILFKSQNLRDWTYHGVLEQSDDKHGYMWECPDFFELDGRYVLMFSPQGMEPSGDLYQNLFQTGYFVGQYDYETNAFKHGDFTELDHGHDFYAVQTFKDDQGRRIAIGWMDMWESNMPTKEDGWAGALTLPRELHVSKEEQILMTPVEELKQLRKKEHTLLVDKLIEEPLSFDVTDDLLEIEVAFDLEATTAGSFGLKVRCGQTEETVISYDVNENKLSLDRSKSGKGVSGVRRVKLPEKNHLSLRIYLDRSSIEVFANEGIATLTSRIYPVEQNQGLSLFQSDGKVKVTHLKAWELEDIWKN
ncbi:sucrose-6-phosphate hydrolase [Terrilactibacillus sp. BCM23-1]|uniref:Sucrose-6-phosphate hydrolase n=1 Tax=Terrilactibacillus tamarindi TaxID=2599694 RepID=A0A6N8CU57_9BACI|nr:glycoside hydrolase family 32 protein [Terrilactibacillus tamarindi]MTT33320.1 sucrose-6-phosphate hydrolase [Terrilactibacillus tamarindi]